MGINLEDLPKVIDEFMKCLKNGEEKFSLHYSFVSPCVLASIVLFKSKHGSDIKIYVSKKVKEYAYRLFGESFSSNTHPIKELSASEKFEQEKYLEDIINFLELEDGIEEFKYLLSELIDNAQVHSGTGTAYVYAQRFPNKREVEFAVIDFGCGFLKTISRKYPVKNEIEAIKKALEKGVSGNTNTLMPYGDTQRHAGMGLFVISNMVKDSNGTLVIVSNNGAYLYPKRRQTNLENGWQGSIVAARLNIDSFLENVADYGISTYIDKILGRNEEEDTLI